MAEENMMEEMMTEETATKETDIIKEQKKKEFGVKAKVVVTGTTDFFGPGLFHLLQHIEKTGSIHAASKEMGISYSKCWKLLNRAEEQAGFPFLRRQSGGPHGGNSVITEEGRKFMNHYEVLLEEMREMAQTAFQKHFEEYL